MEHADAELVIRTLGKEMAARHAEACRPLQRVGIAVRHIRLAEDAPSAHGIDRVLIDILLEAGTDQPAALRQPPQPATFAAVTAPLWRYLDALHPALWRAGKDFPASPARMDAMLNQGTLRLSLTFNPLHARQKAASGELPTDSYSFGFTAGTLGNVHFVTIPANARAVAGAKVVANFLLSP